MSEMLWRVAQGGRTGYAGVALFFVLSGFLITRILLRERVRTGTIQLPAFYLRRALRIFPMYYLCVILTALAFSSDKGTTASLLFYYYNLYYALYPQSHPMEHSWSLAVEEQFYLIWPFVLTLPPLRWGARATGIIVPALAVLCAMSLASLLEPVLAADFIYHSLPTQMLSLSLGAFLAFRDLDHAPLASRSCGLLLVAGVVILCLDATSRAVNIVSAGGWYWCVALAGYSMVGLGTVAYLAAAETSEWLPTVLAKPVLRYIGRTSYGIYIYHVVALHALDISPAKVDGGAGAGRTLAALGLTFALSAISYVAVEQPLLALKSRLGRSQSVAS